MLSGLHEKPIRNKYWVTEKKYMEEIVRETSLFELHALLSVSLFVAFFVYPLPRSKGRIAEWPLYKHSLVFCDMIWVNGQKYENLLQFHFSWLASLRMWYYFGLCFVLAPLPPFLYGPATITASITRKQFFSEFYKKRLCRSFHWHHMYFRKEVIQRRN